MAIGKSSLILGEVGLGISCKRYGKARKNFATPIDLLYYSP